MEHEEETTLSLRRLSRFLLAAGLGLCGVLAGLAWDASLHARDHTLAAREGVMTLTNPAHALFAAGVFLASLGVAGAITTLAKALGVVSRGRGPLQGLRTRGFAVGLAAGLALAGGVPAVFTAARSALSASGEADLLHAAAAATGPRARTTGVHGAPQGKVEGGYGDGTFPAEPTLDGGVKVFRLRAAPIDWEVEPGVVKKGYAFNGRIPGPIVQVNEGDRVRMVVENALPEHTSIHWHGMILPNDQDGVPGLTQRSIAPGETYTYEFTAVAAGTHWYHTHMGGRQIGKGLYGALQVTPRLGDISADRDYHLFIGDTDLGFTFNGRTFPATVPLPAKVGERIRLRLFGTGDSSHPVHLHGFPFQVLAQDGIPLTFPQRMDTLLVSPGQTFDVLIVPQTPGRWLLHCHVFSHSEGEDGMTGLVTTLDVADGTGGSSLPNLPIPNVPGLPMLNQGAPSAPRGSGRPAAPAPNPEAGPNPVAELLPQIGELLRKLPFGSAIADRSRPRAMRRPASSSAVAGGP